MLMQHLLDFSRQIGKEASQKLLACRGRAGVDVKADGSLVTEADREADRLLRNRIGARFPDHGILTEESSTIYEGRPVTWVIDPLDGTTNFALGICYWGCSIAVLLDGTPVVGVLVMPELGLEFSALRDHGAYLNGAKLGGDVQSISERHSFVAVCSRTFRYLDLPIRQKARLLGSAAYDLAAVAHGGAVGCTQVLSHVWDLAASWLFLHEAGRAVGPLFPGAPSPFPLLPGVDYADRVFPLAAAVDQTTLKAIQDKAQIRPEAQSRFQDWSEAGWDLGIWRERRHKA